MGEQKSGGFGATGFQGRRVGQTGWMLSLAQIELDMLVMVMEDNSFDQTYWIDPTNGAIHGSFDDDFDEEAADEAGWVAVEPFSSLDSYSDMQLFIATVDQPGQAARLSDAIVGKGAFRRFKDIVFNSDDLGPRWRAFEEARRRARAIEWLVDAKVLDAREANAVLIAIAVATSQLKPDSRPALKLVPQSSEPEVCR